MNRNITGGIALAMVMLCLLLGGPAEAGDVLNRIQSSGIMKVSTNGMWPPQSFLNEANELDGFDIDVAKEVAKRLGAKAEFVTPEWAVVSGGRWAGRWDVSVGSMTPTAERAKILDFPAIYYYTPASFAVHRDSAIQSKQELNAKRIGTITSSTYEQYLKGELTIDATDAPPFTYDVKPGSIQAYATSPQAFDDLRLGDGVRLDGMIDSLPSINDAIKSGYPLRVVGTPAFYEPLAVAIEKGDPEFRSKLSEIIAAMHTDGTLTALSMKWYGIDYTTSGSRD